MRQGHFEISAYMARISAEHNNPVCQKHRFFDIVRHNEDGTGGNRLVLPKLEQFAAEVLRCQHIQCGEGLVHEEDFGLNHEGACKAYTLAHAAGELFWVCSLETVQTDSIQHLERSFAALGGFHAPGFQRGFDVFGNGQPGKQGEALEDDGDIHLGFGIRVFRASTPGPQKESRGR